MKKIIQLLIIATMVIPTFVSAENNIENIENTEQNQEIIENTEAPVDQQEEPLDPITKPILKYKSHVQNIGWQDYVGEDQASGTDHQSLRLESFIIDLENQKDNIEYRSYVEGSGWETSWHKGGEISGTVKQSKRLEAIQIRLLGDLKEKYDVYYMVHSEDFGWFPWAKNEEISGSIGFHKRIESIRIKLVEKGTGEETQNTYKEKNISILYNSHIQDIGWMKEQSKSMTGTLTNKRLESFYIKLDYQKYPGKIHYSSYVEGIGWQEEKADGEYSGTDHQSKRIEALKIRLSGELENHYDIYYRVYTESFQWTGWAKNNEIAGSLGYDEKITAIDIKLVDKGTGEATGNSFKKKEIILKYAGYVQDIGEQDYVSERQIAGTIGRKLRVEGITINLDSTIEGTVEYTTRTDREDWQEYKTSNVYSGTKHKSRAIQNIRIRLTGELQNQYDIYYRVHSATYGWLGWAKNDEIAGVNHYSIEAIEIRLYKKDDPEKETLKVSNHYIAQVTYKPFYYNQKDPRWINRRVGLSTIGKSGCAPTSMAMAFQGILDRTIEPTEVAEYLYKNTKEYNRVRKGSSGQAIIRATDAYGIKRTALKNKEELTKALQDGKIVFAAMGNGTFGRPTYNHAIILYGFQSNKTNVYDPLTQKNNRLFSIDQIWREQSKDPDDYSGGSNFYSLERY